MCEVSGMDVFWIGAGIAWVATVLWLFWCDDDGLAIGYGKEKSDDRQD